MDTCSFLHEGPSRYYLGPVINNQNEHSFLHVLENEWTFWYDLYPGPGLTTEQYASALTKIGGVRSVQSFWQYFNNLPSPDELGPHTSYHLMKAGTLPLWEDRNNWEGGSLAIKVGKDASETVWMTLLLCAIGEQFSNELHCDDDIQGVSINIRKSENMVFLWNKRADLLDPSRIYHKLSVLLPDVPLGEPVYRIHRNEVTVAQNTKTSRQNQKRHSPPKNVNTFKDNRDCSSPYKSASPWTNKLY